MPSRDNSLRLPDGRRLGYAEYGDGRGRPVFVFHGIFGSRLERHPDDAIATRLHLRLIMPERPGFGLSDPQPGRRLLDWPADVAALADALGIDRFAVLGISAGGPYAAACAAALPTRLTAVGIVSGVGPVARPQALTGANVLSRLLFALARHGAGALPLPLGLIAFAARRDPYRFQRIIARSLSASDRKVLADKGVQDMLAEDLRETFRQGIRGAATDLTLFGRSWGFRLGDVAPGVQLWHGTADPVVPLGMAEALARALPECRARFLPDEGHFLVIERWEEILQAIA